MTERNPFVPLVLVALFLAACSSDSDPATPPPANPGAFSLAVTPLSVSILPGATGELTITITRTGGFQGAVSVSAEGLPVGVTTGALSIPATSGSGTLVLDAAPGAAATEATVTLRGTTSVTGVSAQTATATVAIAPPPNPVPQLNELDPEGTVAGGSDLTLTVIGAHFVEGTQVRWNDQVRPTTVVSGTELKAEIPAADVAEPGTAEVTVFNPAPGGGGSNALSFAILPPGPVGDAWEGEATYTLRSPRIFAIGDEVDMILRKEVTNLRLERVGDTPDGAARYEVVAGDVLATFWHPPQVQCGNPIGDLGPVQAFVEQGFLEVLQDPDDLPSVRYRALGTMDALITSFVQGCMGAGQVTTTLPPVIPWIQTWDDSGEEPGWQEAVDPNVIEGSRTGEATFFVTFEGSTHLNPSTATVEWSWRLGKVE